MNKNNNFNRKKLTDEALNRLSILEEFYDINPKIKTYFEDGKLYYSYITGGGYLGSIDTINYDKRYVDIVESFEKQTSCVVYHVIEHEDTIALLFVSNNCSDWCKEQPTSNGVMALVVDMNSYKNERGYIKLDVLQGALRRRDGNVYSNLSNVQIDSTGNSDFTNEIIERIQILKSIGLITDLDLDRILVQENDMCYSEPHSILGEKVCVINRLSDAPQYKQFVKNLSEKIACKLYFLMASEEHNKLALLFITDDPKSWNYEKLVLQKSKPYAIVVDLEKSKASIKQIKLEMHNGGPLFIE